MLQWVQWVDSSIAYAAETSFAQTNNWLGQALLTHVTEQARQSSLLNEVGVLQAVTLPSQDNWAELGLSSTSSAHFWRGSNRPKGEALRNDRQNPLESVGEVLTEMDMTTARQAHEAGL